MDVTAEAAETTLFPACAGVIPTAAEKQASCLSFPRMRGGDPRVACGCCKRAHTRRKHTPAYEIHDIEKAHSYKKDISFHAVYARIKERKTAACAADSLHLLAD